MPLLLSPSREAAIARKDLRTIAALGLVPLAIDMALMRFLSTHQEAVSSAAGAAVLCLLAALALFAAVAPGLYAGVGARLLLSLAAGFTLVTLALNAPAPLPAPLMLLGLTAGALDAAWLVLVARRAAAPA